MRAGKPIFSRMALTTSSKKPCWQESNISKKKILRLSITPELVRRVDRRRMNMMLRKGFIACTGTQLRFFI
jgi:hypothetical protein